jgi:drug/metabolite transporter (DMT)-like permease
VGRVAIVLVICGITGASIFVLVKVLTGYISAVQLVGARVVLAAVCLSLIMLATRTPPKLNRGMLQAASLLALFDAILPYMLIALAAPHILASTSALLIATMPAFTAVFVSAVDRNPVSRSIVAGLAFGTAGVSILAGPTALDFGSSGMLAVVAVVLAAASYAAAGVYSRVPLRTCSPLELSATKFVIASIVLLPLVLLQSPAVYLDLGAEAWLALFGIGFLATGVARLGYVWVVSTAGSVSASLLTYIVPVAALALAWVFLGEMLSWRAGTGAALVGASVTCVLFGERIAAFLDLPAKSSAVRGASWGARRSSSTPSQR